MVPAFGANVTVASGPAFADAARSFFGNVRFGVFGQEECKTRLESAALGSCRLSRVETGANIVIGSRIVQRSYDVDAIKLILQVSGRSSWSNVQVFGSRSSRQRRNWAVCRNREPSIWS